MRMKEFEKRYASDLSLFESIYSPASLARKRYVKVTSGSDAKKFITLAHKMGFTWGNSDCTETYFRPPATYYVLFMTERQIRITHNPTAGCEIINFKNNQVTEDLDVYKKEMV